LSLFIFLDADTFALEIKKHIHKKLNVTSSLNIPVFFIDPVLKLFGDPCGKKYKAPGYEEIKAFEEGILG
jgi:hypothetical protein